MADLDAIAATVGSSPEDPFVVFMGRVDDLITARTEFGVFDFVDADWGGLFEDDPDCDDQVIIDTLADADNTFAAMIAGEAP